MNLTELINSLVITDEQAAALQQWATAREAEIVAAETARFSEIQTRDQRAHDAALAEAIRENELMHQDMIAALTRTDEMHGELEATRTFAAGIITQAEAALVDDKLGEDERISLLAALVAEARKPADKRAREAKLRDLERLRAEIDEMDG